MARQRAKNRMAANADKVYSIDEIKSIINSPQMISPYVYRHIILQLLNPEVNAYITVKHLDKFNKKPEDYVTY